MEKRDSFNTASLPRPMHILTFTNLYTYTEAVESINGLLGTSDLDPVYHVETSRTFNNPVGANVHSLRKL